MLHRFVWWGVSGGRGVRDDVPYLHTGHTVKNATQKHASRMCTQAQMVILVVHTQRKKNTKSQSLALATFFLVKYSPLNIRFEKNLLGYAAVFFIDRHSKLDRV